ncbi:uncharacterized protein LOC115738028 [Rhodamnia argentea]|uniref:Uncharacterized protein LOC115738028 n=1 Tax=Rhodamnia argentea TaxID=178133 RepID=A0A8B8NVV3_9MYRT|nr:uncharacterized protein LOC115738028 [Rhodamnia argentea]
MAHQDPTTTTHMAAPSQRWPPRRRTIPLRRRKLPTVRLGGKRPRPGLLLLKMWRKMRLRWLKLRYSCMLKKLKEYYRSLIADIIEAGAAVETFQQRMLMETACAVPGMGFNNFPSVARHRATIF